MPAIPDDKFAITRPGELAAIRAYVKHRPTTTRVTADGAAYTFHQITPKLGGNHFTARIGDVLEFRGGLLLIASAPLPPAPRADSAARDSLFEVAGALQPRRPPQASTRTARRNHWQRVVFDSGYHPVSKAKLADDAAPANDPDAPGRRCGTCRFHRHQQRRGRTFPACLHPGDLGKDEIEQRGYPFASRGAATDVHEDWPACIHHSYGDPELSPDAARCVPEGATP